MADARKVLEETILEANLLAGSGGTLEELQELARLAYEAFTAENGVVPDKRVRILHPSRWHRLGVS